MAKINQNSNSMRVSVNENIPTVTGHIDMSDIDAARENMELASKIQTELMVQDKIIGATLRGKRLELQAANVQALKQLDKAEKECNAKQDAFDAIKGKFVKACTDKLTERLTKMTKAFYLNVAAELGKEFPCIGEKMAMEPVSAWQVSVYVNEEAGKLVATASFGQRIGGTLLRDIKLSLPTEVLIAHEDLQDAEQAVAEAEKLIADIQTQAAACGQLEEQLRHAADAKACALLDPNGTRLKAAKDMADSIVKVPTVKQLAAPKKK